MLDDPQRDIYLPGILGKEQTLKSEFQLTNDEYQELALFKHCGRDLYTGCCIFRDHISAARLRLCLKEMDHLDPMVFKRRVIYFKSRAELRRRPYIQRIKAMERAKRQGEEQAMRQRDWSAQCIKAEENARHEGERRAWLPREPFFRQTAAMEKASKGGIEKAESRWKQ